MQNEPLLPICLSFSSASTNGAKMVPKMGGLPARLLRPTVVQIQRTNAPHRAGRNKRRTRFLTSCSGPPPLCFVRSTCHCHATLNYTVKHEQPSHQVGGLAFRWCGLSFTLSPSLCICLHTVLLSKAMALKVSRSSFCLHSTQCIVEKAVRCVDQT